MSSVSSVLLLTLPGETGVVEIQKWLESRGHLPLEEISGAAGANRGMECEVWAAGLNYLDEAGLVEFAQIVSWWGPAQLLIQSAGEPGFKIRLGLGCPVKPERQGAGFLIGLEVRANHPITCANPEPTFRVHEAKIDQQGKLFVRGEHTIWFHGLMVSRV